MVVEAQCSHYRHPRQSSAHIPSPRLSHLLLQDIDFALLHFEHVLHVPDFSSKGALLLCEVLQLFGLLVQEGLFLLQTQTQSIHLS